MSRSYCWDSHFYWVCFVPALVPLACLSSERIPSCGFNLATISCITILLHASFQLLAYSVVPSWWKAHGFRFWIGDWISISKGIVFVFNKYNPCYPIFYFRLTLSNLLNIISFWAYYIDYCLLHLEVSQTSMIYSSPFCYWVISNRLLFIN